jgi:hypothetical protein
MAALASALSVRAYRCHCGLDHNQIPVRKLSSSIRVQMVSSLFRQTNNKLFSRDQLATRLVLVIGVAGLVIVFLIPDPLPMLAPQLPLLTPADWPRSHISTKLFFTDNWRVSYNAGFPWSPFLWEEKRGFYQSLNLAEGDLVTSVEQTIVWYANPSENANVWKKELDAGTYNGWPIVESRLSSDKPASLLACNPDLASAPHQCWYLAYWEHWFSAIFFYRQFNEDIFNEDLLMQDIHQLTARADELLMVAPPEPCFWFLCTNISRERNASQQ